MDTEQQEMTIDHILKLVSRSQIASIRNVVSGLISIINDPESTSKDLQDIIELDPPLAARVLKVANSAYYSPRSTISGVEEAIIWIGFDALKELALNQTICRIFGSGRSVGRYSKASLWKHSVAVAVFCKMIYRREFGEKGEDAYVAGLLHEIGIIIEDQFLNKSFNEIINKTENEGIDFIDAEDEVLPFNHSDIGMAVAAQWKFPQELVMAIGCHHTPENAPGQFSKIVSTLSVADIICRDKGIGYNDAQENDSSVLLGCLKDLSIEPLAIDLIIPDLEHEISRLESQGMLTNE